MDVFPQAQEGNLRMCLLPPPSAFGAADWMKGLMTCFTGDFLTIHAPLRNYRYRFTGRCPALRGALAGPAQERQSGNADGARELQVVRK